MITQQVHKPRPADNLRKYQKKQNPKNKVCHEVAKHSMGMHLLPFPSILYAYVITAVVTSRVSLISSKTSSDVSAKIIFL